MNDREKWIWSIASLALACLTLIIIVSVSGCYRTRQKLIENGYEEVAYPGSQVTYWHKVQTNNADTPRFVIQYDAEGNAHLGFVTTNSIRASQNPP